MIAGGMELFGLSDNLLSSFNPFVQSLLFSKDLSPQID